LHSWLTLIYKNKTRAGRIPTPQDVGSVKVGCNPTIDNIVYTKEIFDFYFPQLVNSHLPTIEHLTDEE
jgi:hypothetical protein